MEQDNLESRAREVSHHSIVKGIAAGITTFGLGCLTAAGVAEGLSDVRKLYMIPASITTGLIGYFIARRFYRD